MPTPEFWKYVGQGILIFLLLWGLSKISITFR